MVEVKGKDGHERDGVDKVPVVTARHSTGVMMVSLAPIEISTSTSTSTSEEEEYCTPPESPTKSYSSDVRGNLVIDVESAGDVDSGLPSSLGLPKMIVCESDGGDVSDESPKVVQEARGLTASLHGQAEKAPERVGFESDGVDRASETVPEKSRVLGKGPVGVGIGTASPIERSVFSDKNQVLGKSSGTTGDKTFHLLSALKKIAENRRNPGSHSMDFNNMTPVEVAQRCGITFPRPRWWPKDKEMMTRKTDDA